MAITLTNQTLSKTEAAYLAGFVDADGSIGVVSVHSTKQYVGQLCVVNRSKDIIDTFQTLFGGKIRIRNQDHPTWQTCYEWKITALRACDAIKLLYPYLRQKRIQAEIVLEVHVIKSEHSSIAKRWDPELKKEQDKACEKLKIECQQLNKRGR